MITLPWPPKELNPNARVHHHVLAKHKKRYKELCWALTLESKVRPPECDKIHLEILFVPPNRQRRDLDNCLAAMKAGIDGIAQAWGIDDNRFKYTIDIASYIGGMVKIVVYPARCGEEESRLAHNQEIDGANPSTATKHMGIA